MPTPNPNGNPDSFFIGWVRRKLRDQPAWLPETIPTTGTDGVVGTAGSKPYRTQRAPIIKGSVTLTAPSPTNMGITAWTPTYNFIDAVPPAPVISDGGVAGSLFAGSYYVFATYITSNGETVNGPGSNLLAIVANHQISVASFAVPAGVTAIKYYLAPATAGASVGGLITSLAPIGGASPAFTIVNAANGTLPIAINPDTGEIYGPAAPIAGNLNITYQATRFSDQQVLDALTDGMKAMYPQVWQLAQDTSLAPSSILYEYTLPAAFADMRVVLMEVELRVPNIPVIPYKNYKRWKRVGPLALAFMDRFSPAGVIRLNYNAPYGALSDLEPIAMHLPCYYAMMLLLKEQEAMRTRATEMVPQTGEGGVKSGDAMATSRDWKDLFEAELERLGRPQPIRPDVPQEYEIFA